METSCVFCKIIAGEKQAEILYQDEKATAFRDAHPAAPIHVLIVPNRHIEGIDRIEPEDGELIGHLFTVANQVAKMERLEQSGYRLLINNGQGAGQSVFHLHVHLLGGKKMGLV